MCPSVCACVRDLNERDQAELKFLIKSFRTLLYGLSGQAATFFKVLYCSNRNMCVNMLKKGADGPIETLKLFRQDTALDPGQW